MIRDPDPIERLVRVEERSERILDELGDLRDELKPILCFVRTRITIEKALIQLGVGAVKISAVLGVVIAVYTVVR